MREHKNNELKSPFARVHSAGPPIHDNHFAKLVDEMAEFKKPKPGRVGSIGHAHRTYIEKLFAFWPPHHALIPSMCPGAGIEPGAPLVRQFCNENT